jgi:hypothetical protein
MTLVLYVAVIFTLVLGVCSIFSKTFNKWIKEYEDQARKDRKKAKLKQMIKNVS